MVSKLFPSVLRLGAMLPRLVVAVAIVGWIGCGDGTTGAGGNDGSSDVGAGDAAGADDGGRDVDAGGSPGPDSETGDGEHFDATGDTSPEADATDSSDPTFVGSWGGRGRDPGEFIEPSSVSMDSEGFVYVAGHENRFQKFKKDGELVDIYGSPGTGDGEFNHPHGIVVDRERGDRIYVGDQENHRLQVFETDGTFVRAIGNQQLEHIHDIGLAVGSGDIFVGDYEQDVLRKFSPTGDLLATFGASGTGPGEFDGVWGVTTDASGNLYVADAGNGRLQKLAPDGSFLDQWSGYGGTPFDKPTGVFIDAEGIVYVCDSLAQEIALFERDGTFLRSWDLQAITGLETEPEDLVIGESGTHIYVAEVRGHRILHLVREESM